MFPSKEDFVTFFPFVTLKHCLKFLKKLINSSWEKAVPKKNIDGQTWTFPLTGNSIILQSDWHGG